jgi:5-methylcytosine-specific restriction endonuclease McrA
MTTTYQQYLRSLEWQVKRKAVLIRANYRCEQCDKRARLDVHHKTYDRKYNEYLTDLQALCRLCHKSKHSWFWFFISTIWRMIK